MGFFPDLELTEVFHMLIISGQSQAVSYEPSAFSYQLSENRYLAGS